MNKNKNNNRVTISFTIPDINIIGTNNIYHCFSYKELFDYVFLKLLDLSWNKINSILDNMQITIKISQIQVNKLNNKRKFITTETYYNKGSIYFDRFMGDIFRKLIKKERV